MSDAARKRRHLSDRDNLQRDVTQCLSDWVKAMDNLERRGTHPLQAIQETPSGRSRRAGEGRVPINEMSPQNKAMDRAMLNIRDWLGEQTYRCLCIAAREEPIRDAAKLLRMSASTYQIRLAEGRAWLACMISQGQI